ncbi:MAG: NHLP leader peptide family RiPP precursor [Bacillota bacterium]
MGQTTKSILEHRKELEAKVIEKAWADENFKKELMADPHQVLAQFGLHLPRELEIKVLEESAKVVYLVLPVNQEVLSDEQLDQVAGGSDFRQLTADEVESGTGLRHGK